MDEGGEEEMEDRQVVIPGEDCTDEERRKIDRWSAPNA
jgi:hypothetical protein